MIKPIRTKHNGVWYRSALEADWAATFDTLGIDAEYEPKSLQLPSGAVYICDFFLRDMNTFCEVKGAHNERLWKPRELAAALHAEETFPQEFQVIVLRAATSAGVAAWETTDGATNVRIVRCDHLGVDDVRWGFMDWSDDGTPFCRLCPMWPMYERNDAHDYLGYTSGLSPASPNAYLWQYPLRFARAERQATIASRVVRHRPIPGRIDAEAALRPTGARDLVDPSPEPPDGS